MQAAARPGPPTSLLELPDPCLQTLLQCCASYPGTLLSAARAHSRLHALALPALGSVGKAALTQEQADSLQLYLSRHGQHVSSLHLQGVLTKTPLFFYYFNRGQVGCRRRHPLRGTKPTPTLHQLPYSLGKLSSLALEGCALQLQPGSGYEGVLHCADMAPLKHLQLRSCLLLDGEEHLAAALAQLTGLEHLSVCDTLNDGSSDDDDLDFPCNVLPCLQQLTCLELSGCNLSGGRHPLQGLQPLLNLQELRMDLRAMMTETFRASVLTVLTQLTLLELLGRPVTHRVCFEPNALAGMTQLRHLHIRHGFFWNIGDDPFEDDDELCARGVAELLPRLLWLEQLTHLDLQSSENRVEEGNTAAAAVRYGAITASTKLQHVNISQWLLPQAAWQHMFPAGRLLPDLRLLSISRIVQPEGGGPRVAPEGTRLVSCCPGLQSLALQGWDCSTELLRPLQQLSGLSGLGVSVRDASDLALVAQLTGLQQLEVEDHGVAGGLLQLTQLQHLTRLKCEREMNYELQGFELKCEAPGDEPVWRQLLRHHLDHSDPEVARHAAEGLV